MVLYNYVFFLSPLLLSPGLGKIEDLQSHPNEQIYRLAYRLIDSYFDTEDSVSSAPPPQQSADGSHFVFNSNSNMPPEGGFNF